MAHSIYYLVKIPGSEFNRIQKPNDQASVSRLHELTIEGDLWDGMLADDDTGFLVDLTGEWTLCILPYPYSIFIGECTNLPMLNRIKAWEKKLRKALPNCEIWRIDEFLVGPWNGKYDYRLVRHPEAVQQLIEWLPTQDARHWSLLD